MHEKFWVCTFYKEAKFTVNEKKRKRKSHILSNFLLSELELHLQDGGGHHAKMGDVLCLHGRGN